MNMKAGIRRILLGVAGLTLAGTLTAQKAMAEEYTPPSTPELYDKNEPLVPLYVKVKKVKSHSYLGLGTGFGSSNLNGGNGNPKASWDIVGEAGYVKAVSSWSRADFGMEVFHGQIGNSKNTMNIKIGGLAKLGYGYNVSENLYALLRFGYGLALADYTGTLGDSKSETGSVWQLGAQLIAPTDSPIDLLLGFFFTQYGFSDRGSYNAYEGRIGVRVRL